MYLKSFYDNWIGYYFGRKKYDPEEEYTKELERTVETCLFNVKLYRCLDEKDLQRGLDIEEHCKMHEEAIDCDIASLRDHLRRIVKEKSTGEKDTYIRLTYDHGGVKMIEKTIYCQDPDAIDNLKEL